MKLEKLISVLLIFLILSILILPYLLSSSLIFAIAQNQDTEYPWSTFLHDPKHTGYTESPVPQMPTILWNYTMEGVSWGPVVADGKVFLGSADRKIYALDQMTGAKIWEYEADGEIFASPVVADGKVFFGSFDSKVYALDEDSGEKIWEYVTGGPIGSSPTVVDGKVFIGSTDGKVYALNEATGAKIWEYTTGGPIVYSSPAVAGNFVLIGSNDGYLYALDKYSGVEKWKAEVSSGRWYFASSPAISDNRVFIGSSNYNKTYAFYIYTGSILWEYEAESRILSSPAIAYNKIFIMSTDLKKTKVYALDEATGKKIWEYILDACSLALAVADELVIVPLYNGKLIALHQSNGSKVWDITLGGIKDVGSCPAIADGKIYVAFGNTLYAIISRSTLTISVSKTAINVNETVAIEGDLSPARPNIPIIIEMKGEGETSWSTLATAITESTGHYAYAWKVNETGTFNLRARWEGDNFALPSQSSIQTITVELISTALTISLSETTARVGSAVTIEGDLSPARGGIPIIIQLREEGETSWNTLATVTTDDEGHYSYTWNPDTKGTFELRAYWEGDIYTSASQSDIQTITIEEAPPLITMEQLISIVAVAAVIVAAILYIKKRPKKPKPTGLRITADPKEIFADGKSTSNITVELIDDQGKEMPAEKDVDVSLNATDGEIARSIIIPRGKSSATTILTSSTNIGTIAVTASARGLKDARIEVIFKEKKRYCMHCGARMPLEAKVCPTCGNAPPSGVDTKTCKNCGAIIPEVAKFCRECGASQT